MEPVSASEVFEHLFRLSGGNTFDVLSVLLVTRADGLGQSGTWHASTERGKRHASFDGLEAIGISDQQKLRPGTLGMSDQFGQVLSRTLLRAVNDEDRVASEKWASLKGRQTDVATDSLADQLFCRMLSGSR